jgi:two-component system, LuxR family, sensor kinase FixL
MTASFELTNAADSKTGPTNTLVRRFLNRYLMVLIAVALLVVTDQAVVQPLLLRLNAYAPAIDLAGRQRMLSQKLSKAALAIQVASNDEALRHSREELRTTLAQWSAAHLALQNGDQQLGLPRLVMPDISAAWIELEPHYQAMQSAAGQLVELTSPANHDTVDRNELVRKVGTIVDHEPGYLPIMERIVKLFAQETQAKVTQLRICSLSIAGGVIALLLGVGWFVIRPATRTIRWQVDELELRVAQRTRELSITNQSLQSEIYQRQKAMAKNQQLAAQLAHAARLSAMGHLTASLAHEINQPLGVIANYAEICDLELSHTLASTSGKLGKHVDRIKQAALRAGQIVRRIRNFARPNSRLEANPVDLNVLIRDVVELCRCDISLEGIRLTVELLSDATHVLADPIQIQQVLVNLIQNSIQAMHACPPERRQLHIGVKRVDPSVEVEVRDSGHGFEIGIDSLFTPFLTTKPDGMGIGLSICRSIIEEHHGTIWAESNPTGGAAVLFSLPLIQEQDADRHLHADCVCR